MARKSMKRGKTQSIHQGKQQKQPSTGSHPAALWVRLAFAVVAIWILWVPLRMGEWLFHSGASSELVKMSSLPPQMSVTFEYNGVKTVRGYSGWSPKKDGNPARDKSIMGKALMVKDVKYQHGIGVQAPSEIVFGLKGKVKRFSCLVGADQGGSDSDHVVFIVKADGKQLFKSPVMSVHEAVVPVDLDVTGAKELSLIVESSGTGNDWRHADWLNLKFTK